MSRYTGAYNGHDPTADNAIARADKALARKKRKEIAAKARQIAAAKASVEEKSKR